MMESKRVSTKTAARLMGVSPEYIRMMMRKGRLPIGQAVKSQKHYRCLIYQDLLMEFLGMDEWPEGLE